jgi:hypothetical protein
MALTLTSELDAVNIMLGTIGESPISSLDASTGVADAVIARQVLSEVAIQVQEEGWHFNVDTNFTLTPSSDTGEIFLPANCLEVDTSGPDAQMDVAMRGRKLYDRVNHTFVFTKSIKAELVLMLEFDELPQAARHYITIRAARVFQQRVVGSDTLGSFTERDEVRARTALKRFEAKTADYNILTSNYSVMRVLDR